MSPLLILSKSSASDAASVSRELACSICASSFSGDFWLVSGISGLAPYGLTQCYSLVLCLFEAGAELGSAKYWPSCSQPLPRRYHRAHVLYDVNFGIISQYREQKVRWHGCNMNKHSGHFCTTVETSKKMFLAVQACTWFHSSVARILYGSSVWS